MRDEAPGPVVLGALAEIFPAHLGKESFAADLLAAGRDIDKVKLDLVGGEKVVDGNVEVVEGAIRRLQRRNLAPEEMGARMLKLTTAVAELERATQALKDDPLGTLKDAGVFWFQKAYRAPYIVIGRHDATEEIMTLARLDPVLGEIRTAPVDEKSGAIRPSRAQTSSRAAARERSQSPREPGADDPGAIIKDSMMKVKWWAERVNRLWLEGAAAAGIPVHMATPLADSVCRVYQDEKAPPSGQSVEQAFIHAIEELYQNPVTRDDVTALWDFKRKPDEGRLASGGGVSVTVKELGLLKQKGYTLKTAPESEGDGPSPGLSPRHGSNRPGLKHYFEPPTRKT